MLSRTGRENLLAYMSRKDRRAQIIAAASDIVSSQGLAAATVRAIAAQIGCSPGQIHHHFTSADELRAEGMRAVWERIGPKINDCLMALPPCERLRQLLGTDLTTLHPDARAELNIACRLWQEAWVGHHEPAVITAIAEGTEKFYQAVTLALEDGLASGIFPADLQVAPTAVRLIAAVQGFDLLTSIGVFKDIYPDRCAFSDALLRTEGLLP